MMKHFRPISRTLAVLLVLLLLLTTFAPMAAASTSAVRVTRDTVWEVFIQDTFSYPSSFVYNVGTDPDTIPNMLYENPNYNLMLAFAANYLEYAWSDAADGGYLLTVNPTYFDTPAQRAAVRDYVNRTADSLFVSGMTDLERLTAVNRHLVDHFAYDEDLSIYSVYPFITGGTGVCQSYAQLGVMLLLAGGMDAYPVAGVADGTDHAWIAVRIAGAWYEFDPTYNDSIGYQDADTRVEYLMKTHSQMLSEGRTYDTYAPYTYQWEDGLRETAATASATPVPEATPFPGSPFSDIQPGQWFFDSALQVNEAGLMVGSAGRFLPNEPVSLAQVVTVATRWHARNNGFTDVLDDLTAAAAAQKKPWYHGYVAYALSMDLIRGNEFGTSWYERTATREELAYVLQQAAGRLSASTSLSIPDIGQVNPLFVPSVRIMANAGIITGVDGFNTFNPGGAATRAQLAVMLGRMLLKIA